MARRLRIQFPGAMYHVINRGNYRRDLFATVGAAQVFERLLEAVQERYRWLIHAFVLVRNHFHLALTTPEPNLGDGMHWLLTSFAVRFNRYRSESGHLYQGRFQSPLIQDEAALQRVVEYIHLNPVRAGLVPAAQVADFRWSSLMRLVKGRGRSWLSPAPWLSRLGLADSAEGWASYRRQLEAIAREPLDEALEREVCHSWAIGTHAWKQALARAYRQRALEQDLPRAEIEDIKRARWLAVLGEELRLRNRQVDDLATAGRQTRWKVELAVALRRRAGAPYRWIAEVLEMGSPQAVRVAVCRLAPVLRLAEHEATASGPNM